MAKASKTGRIDYYGTDEIIQKLKKLGANVEEALALALERSAEKPKQEMFDFIAQKHHRTGDTEKSLLTEIEIDKKTRKIYLRVGFNLDKEDGKPGLPALFLNYGTPKQEPTFFIDKAIRNNIDEIKKTQQETLEELAKYLGLK